jgi:ABC-type antimicrobial peptide transport system permease subunit
MPTSENLIYGLVGLVLGGGLGVWGGTYIGKLLAKVEAWLAKEKGAAEADAAHVAALFKEVKTLYAEFDAKAKADAAAIKAAAEVVVQAVEKV